MGPCPARRAATKPPPTTRPPLPPPRTAPLPPPRARPPPPSPPTRRGAPPSALQATALQNKELRPITSGGGGLGSQTPARQFSYNSTSRKSRPPPPQVIIIPFLTQTSPWFDHHDHCGDHDPDHQYHYHNSSTSRKSRPPPSQVIHIYLLKQKHH